MNQPDAITELQWLAEVITLQDLKIMQSVGGVATVHEYVQRIIRARIDHLQHQQEATR